MTRLIFLLITIMEKLLRYLNDAFRFLLYSNNAFAVRPHHVCVPVKVSAGVPFMKDPLKQDY